MKRYLFLPILFISSLFIAGTVSAEYVKNVACDSDKSVQQATKACFSQLAKKGCPKDKMRTAGCRNNKLYCACVAPSSKTMQQANTMMKKASNYKLSY